MLADGKISPLPRAKARELIDHLNGLPWGPTRLDWEQMPSCLSTTIPGSEPDESFEEFCTWVAAAAEGLILVYDEGTAIVGDSRWMLRHLDELTWGAPGPKYLIGADRPAVDCAPILTVIAEYDGSEVLRASIQENGDELSPALVREAEITLAQLCEELSLRYRAAWCGQGTGSGETTIPENFLEDYDFSSAHVVARRRWGIADASSRGPAGKIRLEQVARFDDPELDPRTATLAQSKLVHTIEALVAEAGRRLEPWFGKVPDAFDWIITDEHPSLWNMGHWISTVEWTLEDEVPLESLTPTLAPAVPGSFGAFALATVRWRVAAAHGRTVSSSYSPPRAIVGMRFADLNDPFKPIIDIWRCGVTLNTSFSESEPALIFVHPSTVASLERG